MHSLPDEILVHMCAFLCIATLARLRETCSHWRTIGSGRRAWTNALHKYGGMWHELKNVALSDKFVRYGWSSPLPAPPVSANAIAFWGTIVGRKNRIVATFGPVMPTWLNDIERSDDDGTICSFRLLTDGDSLPVSWVSTALRNKYTNKYDSFVKAATVNMYALAQNATTSTHAYLTGNVEAHGSESFALNSVTTGNASCDLDLNARGVWLHVAMNEYINNERESIRGWGNSIPSIILSQCV